MGYGHEYFLQYWLSVSFYKYRLTFGFDSEQYVAITLQQKCKRTVQLVIGKIL